MNGYFQSLGIYVHVQSYQYINTQCLTAIYLPHITDTQALRLQIHTKCPIKQDATHVCISLQCLVHKQLTIIANEKYVVYMYYIFFLNDFECRQRTKHTCLG